MMNTLFLNPTVNQIGSWDLTLDSSANIAMASSPYSLAQDAASAIRTFLGEVYYDTTQGVPYWNGIIGVLPPIAYMKSQFIKAALTVPGVVAAQVFITGIVGRQVQGQVQVTDTNGVLSAAGF